MTELQIKNALLKLVFITHFILMAWGSQGWWTSDSYVFTNLVFFAILLWGLHADESPEPIQMAVAVNVVCIVLDLILISIRYPSGTNTSDRFSAWMAIFNLVVRPFTTIVLWRIMEERSGTRTGSSYEDIDRPVITPPQTDIMSGGGKI